jgi:hypothetical protein
MAWGPVLLAVHQMRRIYFPVESFNTLLHLCVTCNFQPPIGWLKFSLKLRVGPDFENDWVLIDRRWQNKAG